jgi:hypothetical protein
MRFGQRAVGGAEDSEERHQQEGEAHHSSPSSSMGRGTTRSVVEE